jgi:hypothetical protein
MARKQPSSELDAPSDLARRQLLTAQILGPRPADLPANPNHPGFDFSPEANAAITANIETFTGAVKSLVQVHMTLDTPELDPDTLKQLIIPQAASATAVASSQADAVDMANPPFAADLPLSPSQVVTLTEKHDVYASVATGVKQLLRGIARGRAVNGAARTLMQERARTYVRAEIDRLPEGDPRRNMLVSRLTSIEALEQQEASRTNEIHSAAQRERAEVLEQIDEAQADYDLALVLKDLREERTPNYEALLKAARHLKKQRQAPPPQDPPTHARRNQPR